MKTSLGTIIVALLLAALLRAEDARHTAKATIEFKSESPDPEKLLAANLPRGDVSVVLRPVANTQIFEIFATAPDAEAAATRANQIALSLQSLLNDPNGATRPVTIWVKASAVDATAQLPVEKAGTEFTPWMDQAQMDAFLASLDGDKPGGKNFWDRGHWITAVEGRWHDGKPEHRFRYAETPKGKKSVVWYWWLNANQEEWAGHVERYADNGFTLRHSSTYQRPDGRTIYDGVWHKVVD